MIVFVPIRPELKMFYPAEWRSIVRDVKSRAGGKCEFCAAPDRTFIRRSVANPVRWVPSLSVPVGEELRYRPSIFVVLSAAHRDHRLVDHSLGNLVALCQRCHTMYDRPSVGKVDARPESFQTRPPWGGGGG